MNHSEWRLFVNSLNLSNRLTHTLIRNLGCPIFSEAVESFKDSKDVLDGIKTLSVIRGFGSKSRKELEDKLTEKCSESERRNENKWHNISDGLPNLGVPLMVETFNSLDHTTSIKYPVYYAKDPYGLNYKWYFFTALEGITVLLPEYSEIKKWKYIGFESEVEDEI